MLSWKGQERKVTMSDHFIVQDRLREIEFSGRELGRATTEKDDSLRWTEIVIYKTSGGKYIIERLGRSLIYHVPENPATPAKATRSPDVSSTTTPSRALSATRLLQRTRGSVARPSFPTSGRCLLRRSSTDRRIFTKHSACTTSEGRSLGSPTSRRLHCTWLRGTTPSC